MGVDSISLSNDAQETGPPLLSGNTLDLSVRSIVDVFVAPAA
jgi:hypothetical protein